jgi:rare lipoprotein A
MIGVASYYGKEYQGKKTASGEIYDSNKMTAAHRTLPFGANVRVTDLSSSRSVVVRVNDRGPFARGRIIDLSLAAARKLGIIRAGKATVKLEIARSAAESAELNLSSGEAPPQE